MTWDEIHEIAEELEHIQSDRLIESLDKFLGNPKFDPHGDPIPNAHGKYTLRTQLPLTDLAIGQAAVVIGVKDDTSEFLQHLSGKGINLGVAVQILDHDAYDKAITLSVDQRKTQLTGQTAKNILVKPTDP